MKKKLLVAVMILCISVISSLSAYASNNAEISQDIQNNIEAYMKGPDGEKIDLDVTDIEVKQIPVPAECQTRSNSSNLVAYAATAKTKTGTSSYKKNGIDAASSLTMTWVDGSGVNNKITNLKGYYSVAKGVLKYGYIYWGSTYTGPTFAPHNTKVSSSFDKDIRYTSDDKVAGKVRADSIGYIKSPLNGKVYQLTLKVSPTILD